MFFTRGNNVIGYLNEKEKSDRELNAEETGQIVTSETAIMPTSVDADAIISKSLTISVYSSDLEEYVDGLAVTFELLEDEVAKLDRRKVVIDGSNFTMSIQAAADHEGNVRMNEVSSTKVNVSNDSFGDGVSRIAFKEIS